MYPKLEEDHDQLPVLMEAVCAHASGVCTKIDSSPVAVKPHQLVLNELPAQGLGAEAVLQLFGNTISPSLTASAGPRHLGFVTGGATPAALLGDWLTSVYDQNPVSNLDGDAALQVERHTVAMLRSLFGLPSEFEGTLVSGATMSNFVGLAIAREWAGRACGVRVSDEGVSAMPRFGIFSATPHSSSTKALSMLGMGRKMWQEVPCLSGREAMDMGALEQMLATCEGPCMVIASAGTVNTGDFDNFAELARLKQSYGFYLHVDAAFGGFASVSPDLRPLVEGWSCADSICIDLHKWLNVPYDSAVAFTRHRDLQADVFANVSAYLGRNLDPGTDPPGSGKLTSVAGASRVVHTDGLWCGWISRDCGTRLPACVGTWRAIKAIGRLRTARTGAPEYCVFLPRILLAVFVVLVVLVVFVVLGYRVRLIDTL